MMLEVSLFVGIKNVVGCIGMRRKKNVVGNIGMRRKYKIWLQVSVCVGNIKSGRKYRYALEI